MNKNIINQTLVVLVTSVILYFSGFHLASMQGIHNLFDGFIVILFFTNLFPCLVNVIRLTHKFIQSLSNFLAI